ncbi:MAG TPA: hypothetical protein VNS63_11200 [Blastocatellia bacterium]|nr:hypothetical protein [Blastocatellia bacterium]
MLLIVLASCVCITEARADGGSVQFTKSAGQFVVTVFTTPSPLRAGPVDISLMIQSRENQQPVLDCLAQVQLSKDGATSIRSEATPQAAQNKLFYAAQVNIPESGLWELEASVRRGDDSVKVAGPITVAPSNPVLLVYWRSLVLPPLFISLFALNQWLKRRSVKGTQP